MELEILFDPKIFEKESLLKWKLTWKKKTDIHIIYLVMGIIFLPLSISEINSDNKTGYVFMSLAMFLIFVSGNFLYFAFQSKKKLKSQIKINSDLFCKNNAIVKIGLTEDHFKYSDFQQSIRLIWSVFGNFIVEDDTILIRIKNQTNYSFAISKVEVGEENFTEIISLLTSKIVRGKFN